MTKNLIEFIESKKAGDVLTEKDIEEFQKVVLTLKGYRINEYVYKITIEFEAKHQKEVYKSLPNLLK